MIGNVAFDVLMGSDAGVWIRFSGLVETNESNKKLTLFNLARQKQQAWRSLPPCCSPLLFGFQDNKFVFKSYHYSLG
jgi:hypothetical protein